MDERARNRGAFSREWGNQNAEELPSRQTLWQRAVIHDGYYGGTAEEDRHADNDPKSEGFSIHGLDPYFLFLSSKLAWRLGSPG